MNILVIGNGFDLAHGLPTKYGDFLEFAKVIRQITKIKSNDDLLYFDWGDINSQVKKLISFDEICNQRRMWKELLDNNLWIDYFLQCNMYQKENWIDFESEISNVIQSIDRDIRGSSNDYKLEYEFEGLSNRFFNSKYSDSQMSYKKLRDVMYNDLNKLIRALELYLCAFVSNIKNIKILPDIKSLSCDKILSFNYTDTYRKIYDPKGLLEYNYIHGKAELEHLIDSNNMVLGIDEYLPKKRKNKEVEFIAFKKYYQRIYKETGCRYKNWIDDIKEENLKYIEKIHQDEMQLVNSLALESIQIEDELNYLKRNPPKHNILIFGHSLDETDRDILRDLILCDNVHTTIYYHKTYDDNGKDDNGRKDLGSKIANLVKVIGQDELIRRTGGNTKTIEFRLQQDMVEI